MIKEETRGFAVVNFTYRLAPAYKYPAQLEDTCKVFSWASENAEEYGFDIPSKLLPKAVALNCGMYDVTKKGLTGNLIRDLMPQKGTEEELQLITPVLHLNSSFPPSYIMTAEKDFLKDDAMKLHSILDDLGVRNEYHLYDNRDHSLGHVFHLNIRLEDAIKCNDEECDFFRKQLIL